MICCCIVEVWGCLLLHCVGPTGACKTSAPRWWVQNQSAEKNSPDEPILMKNESSFNMPLECLQLPDNLFVTFWTSQLLQTITLHSKSQRFVLLSPVQSKHCGTQSAAFCQITKGGKSQHCHHNSISVTVLSFFINTSLVARPYKKWLVTSVSLNRIWM